MTVQHIMSALLHSGVALLAGVGFLIALLLAGAEHLRSRRLSRQLKEALTALHARDVALAERRRIDSVKDEFISTVSHEIRTPLTSIRGALGLLSAGIIGSLDEKAANLLRIASTNTDRLVRLINDILDLERMESGSMPLEMRRCGLQELTVAAIETMTPLARASEVDLQVVPAPVGDLLIFDGDPDRIQQVLCNLLSNAVKFSPPGSVVRLLSGGDPTTLMLRVEDEGRGIPSDQLDAVFARFAQVEGQDAARHGGTGLGLAICRTIVEQHHGTIHAERNDAHSPGRPGTTFVLHLPRSQSAEEAAAA